MIAKILLEKKAVTLNAKEPYTYASGLKGPIYCDNRLLFYYPEERELIVSEFVKKVREFNPEVIVGTASSGIPWASWIADKLQLPMVYVRKKSKEHGQQRLIEGGDIKNKKVVVIEDLVNRGGSSRNAIESCVGEGAQVLGMVAIFTYGFADFEVKTEYLCTFSELVKVAGETGALDDEQIKLLLEWNKDPEGWQVK